MRLIEIKESDCKKCYACVRICPVKAIRVDVNGDTPQIVDDRCIGCGSCYTFCDPGAIAYHSSVQEAKKLLQSECKVAAAVGPSISGEFSDITDYRKFVEMIRRLGFEYIHEASFGVDLVAKQYAELFESKKGKYYITSNCPAVTSYVEKFHPDLTDNLAPIVSPMIAIAKVLHKKYGENTKVIYIGPCIANKKEALRYHGTDGHVDVVLTFRELRQLFAEFNIKESNLEFSDFDSPLGFKGSLYPISNGFLQAAGISENLLSGTVITTEGKVNMINAVNEFEKHPEEFQHHFNIFYDKGCLMGPGTSPNGDRFLRRMLVVNYANKRLKNFRKKEWEQELALYDDLDFIAQFQANDQRLSMPDEQKIDEVMSFLGKDAYENLGCRSCGYESCRDFAVSVAKGLTKTDMCINFSLRTRQETIQTLKLTNEKLAKTQQALQESETSARHEAQYAEELRQTMEIMIQKLPSSVVMVNENLKIIRANQSFITLLGTEVQEISEVIPGLVGADIKTLLPLQIYNLFLYVLHNSEEIQNRDITLNSRVYNLSVFTIQKNKIIGAVIRDMQAPDIRKEEVVKRISDAIDKNLEMVQKIGFLLGEGAAETEQMLNSIIELYKTVKK
jgi:Na+-translocating ferredoxin:NAD+ oxidoreductase RNF subunit RnfB